MQHLGLISIIFVWVGLIFLIRTWKGNISMTFSQHAAQTKASQIYYLLLFAIELPLFALFMFRWFMPTYELGTLFGFFFLIAMIAQFVAVIVPETKGWRVLVHRYAAFLMSDCMVIINILIALSANISATARFTAAAMAAVQLAIIIYLFDKRAYHPKILPIQTVHVAAFHISILAVTYLG